MPTGPLTPAEDAEPTSPIIDYSPATVPYNEIFENDLMNAILYPETITSNTTDTIKAPTSPPPMINPTTLPIPLSSPLRNYPSHIPGIRLTHPSGYHTGGPGPSAVTVGEFAERFIGERGIQDAGQLERNVEERIGELMEVVRGRMREREEAVRKNEEVRRQLEDLEVQRRTEIRVQEKIKEGRRKV
jgi:hypothetical protein